MRTAVETEKRWRRYQFGFCLALCGTFFTSCAQLIAAEGSDAGAVRAVIGRSVPFIEREGADWIAKKNCVSCHHTAFMVWSLTAAKQKGISVDKNKLKEWTDWATDWNHFASPVKDVVPEREKTVTGHNDAVAQLLLGRPHDESRVNQPQWALDYPKNLANGQQTDGSWIPGGQLPSQKRPKRETQEVSTMWALLALGNSHIERDSLSALADKGRGWLGNETVGKSTEWWATRFMLEQHFGSADKANHYQSELLKRQRADGGWGWLCDDDSDALGTGIALYSLRDDKQHTAHEAIIKARQFLAKSQHEDGSWAVRGTKENRKAKVEATSTFWGTCWAVIGLCTSLDD
jgi:hypothetical protein